jgi:hypothetical protein
MGVSFAACLRGLHKRGTYLEQGYQADGQPADPIAQATRVLLCSGGQPHRVKNKGKPITKGLANVLLGQISYPG